MSPTIKVSSYVICKAEELSELKPMELYVVIVKNKGLFVLRFKQKNANAEYVFISDNRAFDDMIIPESDIKELFAVSGTFLPCFRVWFLKKYLRVI